MIELDNAIGNSSISNVEPEIANPMQRLNAGLLGLIFHSTKAPALEAWGANSNLFHLGFAKETRDGNFITATMAKPGVVLQRPVGTSGLFHEHSDLPTLKSLGFFTISKHATREQQRHLSEKDARKAALAFEREQKQRETQRRNEKAAVKQSETALEDVSASMRNSPLKSKWIVEWSISAPMRKQRAGIAQRAFAIGFTESKPVNSPLQRIRFIQSAWSQNRRTNTWTVMPSSMRSRCLTAGLSNIGGICYEARPAIHVAT